MHSLFFRMDEKSLNLLARINADNEYMAATNEEGEIAIQTTQAT